MSNKMTGIKKATTAMLVITVGIFQSLHMGSVLAQVTPRLAGDLSIKGFVTLNGLNAANRATVFDGGHIKTGNNSSALISLGKRGQIELGPNSELILKSDAETLGGNLRSGQATINAYAGVNINILTSDGIAATDGKDASVLTVDVACGNTRVNSSQGDARVTAGNRVEIVAAGQEVAVGAQQQTATGDPQRCPRLAAARANAATSLTGGALAALILIGLGGAIAGVIAGTQGDNTNPNAVGGVLSFFR